MPSRLPHAPAGARPGFSVAELLTAATLTAVVFAVAIPLFQSQARAVSASAGRLDGQLGVRYALSVIDRDLRSAGVGVVDAQPMIVEGTGRGLTFNADLVSRDSAYAGAVNYDPDAPPSAVGVLERGAGVVLPATGRVYPDCTYVQGAGAGRTDSRAETVSFWVRPDSSSPRADEHVLWRRVNRQPPELVARGIVLNPGEVVFSYTASDAQGELIPVPADSLPLLHVPVHGSPADTGRSSRADRIRVVSVRLAGRSVDRRTRRERVDVVQSGVRLLNAGLLRRTTCGETPLAPSGLTAQVTPAGGVTSVTLRWNAAFDEAGGERDVERYLIFRRLETDPPDFDEPLLSLGAGRTTYEFRDADVEAGVGYVYGVAAQDCSPQNSPVQATAVVRP